MRMSDRGFIRSVRWAGWLVLLAGLLAYGPSARAADLLEWSKDGKIVTANIQSWPLTNLLEKLTVATGWHVYVQPDTSHTVSVKFKEQPVGEALRLLLGNLSFALVPQTGAPPKLLVFRTSMEAATQRIKSVSASLIKDELIVTLKPGESVDDLAKRLNAKVTGAIKGANAYRLKFEDEAGMRSARESLKTDAGVAGVDYNYLIDLPGDAKALLAGSVPSLNLSARPLGDGNPVIVGLVDTAAISPGKEWDAFFLKSLSVAGDYQPGQDQLTHGTAMAETILKGVAQMMEGQSGVRILSVDVYGASTTTTMFDVGAGTYAAINGGANIINYSLGGEGDASYLQKIIKQGQDKGIIFIAAAGNTPGTTPTVPASINGVIAVTAGNNGQIASWANSGDFVSAMTPGSVLVSFGGKTYVVTGTSTSTALASGMAAAIADRTGQSSAAVEAQLLKMIGFKK
jgi:hypothetical protein